jgi:hypothetical protein
MASIIMSFFVGTSVGDFNESAIQYYRLIPGFNLAHGLLAISFKEFLTLTDPDRPEDQTGAYSALNDRIAGKDITYLLIEAFAFVALAIIIECVPRAKRAQEKEVVGAPLTLPPMLEVVGAPHERKRRRRAKRAQEKEVVGAPLTLPPTLEVVGAPHERKRRRRAKRAQEKEVVGASLTLPPMLEVVGAQHER